MKWDKVEVTTEQVIDENPHTWIVAALEDSKAGNYDSVFEKLHQARVFANNNPSILADTYDLETIAYWRQGNKPAAREASRLLREYGNLARTQCGAPRFETDPRLAHVCMLVNPYDDFWYQNWLTSVDYVIKERNFGLIKYILDSDEIYSFTEKTLAEHATNAFVFAVVRASELNLLQALYSGGGDLSSCKNSADGRNLTMEAVSKNCSSDILEFLLSKKINDVDEKDDDGWTALMHWANSLQNFSSQNFELLINFGANVNATNKRIQTALIIAAQSKNHATDKIRLLIGAGANASLRDSNGYEALLYANKADCLKPLIDAGANVNATYNHGQTPLILAAQRNDADSIRLLINSGANVSLKDSSDRDAIYYTSKDYNTDCLRLLGQHGADINQRYTCARGGTLLHKVANSEHWNNSSYWRALLDLGADVNAKDNSGSTPLEYALDHSWTFTAELGLPRALVRKGATVTYSAKEIMRRRGIKESNLYNNSTNFFFSSWFN